jgi:hypothetical protein
MQPGVSLDYSSRAPLRGGIAAGWSLGFPSIELDTSSGTLEAERYTASLGGAYGRLVEVDDTPAYGGTTYRLEQDDAFVIFERFSNPGYWGISRSRRIPPTPAREPRIPPTSAGDPAASSVTSRSTPATW